MLPAHRPCRAVDSCCSCFQSLTLYHGRLRPAFFLALSVILKCCIGHHSSPCCISHSELCRHRGSRMPTWYTRRGIWARPAAGKHLIQNVNQEILVGGYLSLRFQDKCFPTASHPAHTVTLAGYCKCMVMNVTERMKCDDSHFEFSCLHFCLHFCRNTVMSGVLTLGPRYTWTSNAWSTVPSGLLKLALG